jgi:6-pyruvoyltetrahydropterin/6-carboxytetrahydropterin synthase
MYQIAVQRDFVAQHYLIGGDWGAENEIHSHHYLLELLLEGETLDHHGYMVDIVAIEAALDELIGEYRGKLLNEMPAFQDLNPSIEHFSRILCQEIITNITAKNISCVRVKLWENDIAWASYSQPVDHT